MPASGHERGRARIGVISDTHGLLRPAALHALRDSRLILHAGDIGDPEILERLAQIAPVLAVRGNNDFGDWAARLPETLITDCVPGLRVLIVHDLKTLACDVRAAGCAVVVSGHSHRPLIERRDGVLYLNPGSAGPRRFRLPVSCGWLGLDDDGRLHAGIESLEPD